MGTFGACGVIVTFNLTIQLILVCSEFVVVDVDVYRYIIWTNKTFE